MTKKILNRLALCTSLVAVAFFACEKLPEDCGNHFINSDTQFCVNSQTFEKCWGKAFDPLTEFCYENVVYSKCNGQIYTPPDSPCGEIPSISSNSYSDISSDSYSNISSDYNQSISSNSNPNISSNSNPNISSSSNPNISSSSSSLVYFTLTTNAEPANGGGVTASKQGPYASGTQVALTATPASGYKFIEWTGEAKGSVSPINISISKDMNITANFAPTYTITTTVSPNNNTGSVNANPAGPYTEGTEVTLTAVQKTGYVFSRWDGDVTGDVNPATITIGTENINVIAIFVPAVTLTANVSPANSGTITFSKPGPLYPNQTEVKLTAVPKPGYMFTHWNESRGTDTSTTILMDKNLTVQANFAKTAEIGNQIWMAENLNYKGICYGSTGYTYSGSGTNLTSVTSAQIQTYCEKYGSFYDWSTAMDLDPSCNTSSCTIDSPHRGICSSGWHIPTNEEWDELYHTVDGSGGSDGPYNSPTAGKYLKAKSDWKSYSGITNLDTYGFAAMPGGVYQRKSQGGLAGTFPPYDIFRDAGESGRWWSASEEDSNKAYYRSMSHSGDGAGYSATDKDKSGYSPYANLRCVKDR